MKASAPMAGAQPRKAAYTQAGRTVTRTPFTWPPRPFFQAFEPVAIHFADSLQRRLVIQFGRRIVVGIAPVKGAAPFDGAFAALGRNDGDGRGIISDRQDFYVDLVDAIGIAH